MSDRKFKIRDVRIEATALYSSLLDSGIDIGSGTGSTGFIYDTT